MFGGIANISRSEIRSRRINLWLPKAEHCLWSKAYSSLIVHRTFANETLPRHPLWNSEQFENTKKKTTVRLAETREKLNQILPKLKEQLLQDQRRQRMNRTEHLRGDAGREARGLRHEGGASAVSGAFASI